MIVVYWFIFRITCTFLLLCPPLASWTFGYYFNVKRSVACLKFFFSLLCCRSYFSTLNRPKKKKKTRSLVLLNVHFECVIFIPFFFLSCFSERFVVRGWCIFVIGVRCYYVSVSFKKGKKYIFVIHMLVVRFFFILFTLWLVVLMVHPNICGTHPSKKWNQKKN